MIPVLVYFHVAVAMFVFGLLTFDTKPAEKTLTNVCLMIFGAFFFWPVVLASIIVEEFEEFKKLRK